MSNYTEMFAGDTHRFVVVVKDDDGVVIDMSNPVQIKFQMVQAPMGRAKYSSTPVVSKMLDSQGVHADIDQSDIAVGIIRVTLKPADTSLLKGEYYYEFEYTDEYGDVSTLVNGNILIKESIID